MFYHWINFGMFDKHLGCGKEKANVHIIKRNGHVESDISLTYNPSLFAPETSEIII